MPKGKTIIHATLDPNHLNKDVERQIGLVGDAGLTLDALIGKTSQTVKTNRDATAGAPRSRRRTRSGWRKWMPKLNSQRRAAEPVSRDLGSACTPST